MSQSEEGAGGNPNGEDGADNDAAATTAAAAATTTTAAADLEVRRVIVETMTQEELDYFRSIRDYLSTLKQPDREKWIIMEMQKFRAEVEEERRSSDDTMLPSGIEEEEALDAELEEGEEEEEEDPHNNQTARPSTDTATMPADGAEAVGIELGDGLTDEERAFQAFQADEAKKCLNCKRYCHMEDDEHFLYLPCSLCEKRICHLCKRFCYKCGELVCLNCIFTKPKTGRKYCPHCFNDTRLNDRVLKCEICFLKVEIDERIISCWRCYSVACMKTCGSYSNDGFTCRRCIKELKEQEELRNQGDDGADAFNDDLNTNLIKVNSNYHSNHHNHTTSHHGNHHHHTHSKHDANHQKHTSHHGNHHHNTHSSHEANHHNHPSHHGKSVKSRQITSNHVKSVKSRQITSKVVPR